MNCSPRLDVRFTSLCLAGLVALTLTTGAVAQTPPSAAEGRFVDRVYRDADGDHKYVVYEPVGYSPTRKWPVVFYLHGASGRGRDGRAQLVVGLGPAIKARAATLPFLIVFPQNENVRSRLLGGWTDGSHELDRAVEILDDVERTYSVDRSHEVLVGVSMGAFGAWNAAAKTPDRWKGVIAISGGGEPEMVPALTRVPIWAFHAADDRLVPPSRSSDLVAAINAAGGRSYVSIVPTGGHNIGAVVLGRDEVFAWMQNPDLPPVTDLDWTRQPVLADMTNEVPFVTGADVASAARIQINRDLLESLGCMMSDQIPADAMTGWRPGQQEERTGRSITVGDTHYTGHIGRTRFTPLESGQLRVQIELSRITMTISGAQVQGLLLSAQSGPIVISIGYREPVWLTMDVLPQVVDRRLKLQVTAVHFEIPPHNWSVSRPEVDVRGLPFLQDRIADELVEGVDAKKGTIEQSIRDKIPQLMTQLETRVSEMCERTVTLRRWPMPLWQPRFRFHPESVTVSEKGITLTLGARVAALSPKSSNIIVRQFPANHEVLPVAASEGLEIAGSLRLIDAYAAMLASSDVARFHVLDMGSAGFQRLGTHEFWNSVLPADQALDPATELNTEFVLTQPFRLQPQPSVPGQFGHQFGLVIPQLQLQLASRAAGEKKWNDRAVVDFGLDQQMHLNIERPGYAQRKLKLDLDPIDPPRIALHWLDGKPVQVDQAGIASQFQEGWSQSFGSMRRDQLLKDMNLQQLALRWDEVGTTDTHFVMRLQRPGIRIHNYGNQAVQYQARTANSPWTDLLQLQPGQIHEYRSASTILWRTTGPAGESSYRLPLGFEAQVRPDAAAGAIKLFQMNEAAPQ